MKFATMHFSTKWSYTIRHSQYQSRWIWKLKMSSLIPRRGDDIFLRIPTIFLNLHFGSALSVMATDLYLHDLRYQHDFLSTKNALVWWNDAITESWWAFPEGIVQTKICKQSKKYGQSFYLWWWNSNDRFHQNQIMICKVTCWFQIWSLGWWFVHVCILCIYFLLVTYSFPNMFASHSRSRGLNSSVTCWKIHGRSVQPWVESVEWKPGDGESWR